VNPEKWEQMKELFASALAQPPGERSAFLRNACVDEALRAELEALLSNYESDQSFPEDEPPSNEDAGVAGQKIGPYEVIRQIGVGGMGAVYLAVRADDTFNKRVAIKLVRAGVDTQAVLRRFRQERQILAPLDHPNITKLLDGGTTEQGLPYFVMDYVEGTRIDDYCDNHRLSINERIRLFRDVCSAVQYIHQNLVVHRDLKPSNILVTGEGVAKLLDFGIAKLLKPEFFTSALDATLAEFRPMTPGYASPEQVRGEPVTTASDVYSLGVVLYELLTSCRPYKLKTSAPDDIRRAVCEQEPKKPSTVFTTVGEDRIGAKQKSMTPETVATMRGTVPKRLQRQLSGDLDTIVLKALRKEPQRRYLSAEQLSEDLRRHVEGLPVTAHRDTWSYRTGKFISRHHAGVAAAALVVVSLVAGVLATTWQARVAQSERAKAQRQFNDVRRLATSFLFEFHSAIQNLPGSTPARQLVVERALEYLGNLTQEAQGDPSLQRELAEAYLKVGDVQGNPYAPNLGDTQGAARSYDQAFEISKALTRTDAKDDAARLYLGRSYKSLGEVLPLLGKPTEADADLRQAAGILEQLAAAKPNDKELRGELAGCYQVLGDVQGHSGIQNLGDPVGALESYQKALALDQTLLSNDANNQSARRGVAVLQLRIGDLQLARDDVVGAMNNYRSALDSLEGLAAGDPTNAADRHLLGHGYQKVGDAQEELGNNQEALKNYNKASDINEALMVADPTNAQASMSFVVSLRYIGDLLYKMNERAGALAKYERAVAILDRLSAAEPDNVVVRGRDSEMLIFVGQTLAESGRLEEARTTTSRGLTIAKDLAGRADVTPDELYQFAESFLECKPAALREPAIAVEYAKKAVEKSGGTGSDYLDMLAQAYFQNGNTAQAIETEEKALSALPPVNPQQPVSPTRSRLEAQLAKYKAPQKHK
jgi:eukaryotic-like serine/threonine-protein kinase